MGTPSLTAAQWAAYRQAVVAHVLETFRLGFGVDVAERSPQMQRMLSDAARVGVAHVRERRLKDFVPAAELLPWVLKTLRKPALLEPLSEWFGGAWHEAVTRIQTTDVPLSAALDERAFLAAFEWYLNDEARKQRWVHALVDNSEYREMITGVLFEMIRRFFRDEALLSKLPGVGQFLKMGRWGVGKMLPQWEQIVEETTKNFLNKNLTVVLKLSEHYLLASLDEARVRAIGEQVWSVLAKHAPSDLAGAAQVLSDPALRTWTAAHWQALVTGPYWDSIIAPVAEQVLEALCDIRCGALWEVLDLPEDQVVSWNERLWSVLLADLADNPNVAELISEFLAPCFSENFFISATAACPDGGALAPAE
jgi:hypothetical protein